MAAQVRARVSFFAAVKGGVERFIRAGDVYEANDPIVKGSPDRFERVVDEPVVETTTAAPGERRSVRPRSSRA